MSEDVDFLGRIVDRKLVENARRARRAEIYARSLAEAPEADMSRGARAIAALTRREGEELRVISEIKFSSPSAGPIRQRKAGDAVRIAGAYSEGGAAAISVLADRRGFGGSPLDVRRVAGAVDRPVLYKEFVLDELQVKLARLMGASMVLLLVRVLEQPRLIELIDAVRAEGMEPVVEASNIEETERALLTNATLVGVNSRDLKTFKVEPENAARALSMIPRDRVAIFMSGMKTIDDFIRVGSGRADAALVGEGLMRQSDPAASLRAFIEATVGRR